ncbi:hypothetical protein [Leptospira meyeri]|uniref:hypothetical protein n=1 Tax=Leptospira meyeri TaxID=29508 RepID=UPI00223E34C9|nr:hypothetical protein [Leptospira meyeri]MCW7489022.1 hypothetical protein [Leptospira meyeri]
MMKQIRNRLYLVLIVVLTNCMVGTNEKACKYYVERDKSLCEQLIILSPTIFSSERSNGQAAISNVLLVGCATYLKKKKECEREENQYLPGLYGMNLFFENPSFLQGNSEEWSLDFSLNFERKVLS